MNSLNAWCRAASLLGCLALSLEGLLFIHDLATQTRLAGTSARRNR